MTSRRHQRRAALPGAGYARPSSLDLTGLIVTVFGESGGVEGSFDFTSLPGSIELRRAFAAALDRKSGPAGAWRSGETCRNGYWALRGFLEHLVARDDAPSTAAEISAAMWAAWRLSLPHNHTARNRLALLRTVLPLVPNLPTETVTAIDRRIAQSPHPTEVAYSYEQFEQIRSKAAVTFNTALVRIRRNREHLRRWYSGEYASGSTDWVIGEALDAILRTGDVPRPGRGCDMLHRHARVLDGRGAEKTWARLFLAGPEAFALAVLMVASEGWNRSVLQRMRVPDHDPAVGDDEFDIHLVEIHKRRRPVRLRYTSNNLVDTGPDSPGRLMRQAIEATELARQSLELLGRPTDRLLVSRRTGTPEDPFCEGIPAQSVITRWSAEAGLSTPDGTPLRVSLRRVRRTVQVLIRKQPAQNTEQTHESIYVLRDPAARAEAQQTITKGLSDALDHAHAVVKMRIMLGDNANDLIELSDNPDLARAIQRGDMDTATAACTDFFDSPFTDEPGEPCTRLVPVVPALRERGHHPAASATPGLSAPRAQRTARHRRPDRLGAGLARTLPTPAPVTRRTHHHRGASRSVARDQRHRPNTDRPASASKARHVTTSLAASGQADETWPIRPEDPFATTDRLPAGADSDQVSRFGDKRWNYTVLGRRRSEASQTVNWEAFPETLRESFRRAGWALVNLPTPAALLNRAATARVEWPAPGTMAQVFLGWRRFAVWLTDHNVTYLHQVDHHLLADYAAYVGRRGRSVVIAQDDLNAVTLLWGFAPHLLATDRIPMPPWENEGVKHYLATDTTPNENTTAAIHPAVMSPLLIWSLRFLDFADDITAAWREHQRILSRVREHPNPDATDALREFLDTWVAEHGELPGGVARGRRGIAAQYLAGLFDTSERHVKYEAIRYRENNVPVGLHAPLLLPVHGMIHGRKWKPHIHFHEAPLLMTRLATAAMIVILYLSGVRPGEALELQVGCCPDPIDDGTGSIRYQLDGLFFKGARNPDRTPARSGVPREMPWTVVPPVAAAVGVLERIVDGPMLFPTNPPWLTGSCDRRRPGNVMTTSAANTRIRSFIAWVNGYATSNGLDDERIPDDPDGDVVVMRLRRTVAWHIGRLPGGRIALALQYGHLRTSVVGEGYSGRARQGLRRILDVETARAMADYLDTVADELHHGQGVSGPAAGRMIQAARNARSRFEGKFLTPRQAEALLEEPEFHVYDNPNAFLTCNHDPVKALCHPERTRRNNRALPPAIDRCDPACANIARTDTHIDRLGHEITELADQVASPLTPVPLKERFKQRITALQRIADRHERTKTTTSEEPGQS